MTLSTSACPTTVIAASSVRRGVPITISALAYVKRALPSTWQHMQSSRADGTHALEATVDNLLTRIARFPVCQPGISPPVRQQLCARPPVWRSTSLHGFTPTSPLPHQPLPKPIQDDRVVYLGERRRQGQEVRLWCVLPQKYLPPGWQNNRLQLNLSGCFGSPSSDGSGLAGGLFVSPAARRRAPQDGVPAHRCGRGRGSRVDASSCHLWKLPDKVMTMFVFPGQRVVCRVGETARYPAARCPVTWAITRFGGCSRRRRMAAGMRD